MLYELIHHGVVVPEPPKPIGLTIRVRGQEIALTPKQEEMALAFARKKDTPYVQDEVFVANFMRDFSAALGIEPPLRLDEVDFGPCYAYIEAERAAKEALSPEERKALALERRREREALKARYGYAIVNGQRVELGTYMVEPSGIFMGRGQHPLRGRWKEGAQQRDITLNLGPDPSGIEGEWAEIVWQPESLWVARWKDKLTGKLKYIWLSDTAPIKQIREAQKFDKAIELEERLAAVRQEIERALAAPDPRRRMIATACYLIDALCLRVGDEKEPDEADTVGATTLRPEHVVLHEDGTAEFHFLGKDSVEWHKTLRLPEQVLANLRELIANARPSSTEGNGGHPTRDLPQIFPDITSRDVNAFLSEIMPGLTAKVFRTHHATQAVETSLESARVKPADPEYVKWKAASLANLEAAILCNHTKQARGDWTLAEMRYKERRQKAQERLERSKEQVRACREALSTLKEAMRQEMEGADDAQKREKIAARYRKRLEAAENRLRLARERAARAQAALGKIEAQHTIARHKRTWNLGTSLKSYIDPRVYHRWGERVAYDALERYYPTALRRKFAWVKTLSLAEALSDVERPIRTCMSSDLVAVADLFQTVGRAFPGAALPMTPEEIGERFLPDLHKSWREAFVALGEEHEVRAMVALGPVWEAEGQAYLDLFAVMRPGEADEELAERLAFEIERRLQAYRLHNGQDIDLRPQDTSWFAYAPALVEALELAEPTR